MPVSKSDLEGDSPERKAATPDQRGDHEAHERRLQDADPNKGIREEQAKTLGQPPEASRAPVEGMPASESGDPAIHYLLAEAETARLNGNQERVDALNAQLGDLGYKV